ncbi:integron gene cassette protein [Ilyonectria robusta]|uniref:integron gene cassette protein n=1 Tax=Ilyonectria robusta TaxID=1079257 RepID=UPI001E8D3B1C|nr:integron gene cassette protein [Ilyonectria robusta]KAH8664851.1 integron gene cassette protein [Ilyonectria robusta]
MANPTSDGGETSLSTLLSTLTTTLHPVTFVFVTQSESAPLPPLSDIQLMFRESEGITIITTLENAVKQGMEYSFPSRMITLNVHSSLEAVGFMAVIATKLAEKGMGVNPVSGFYHDHLFVPIGREEEALETLAALAEEKSPEAQK